MQKQNNYAFIDGNNLILGLRNQDWKIDYQKFHRFLKDKYRIMKAFWFVGYISGNEKIYQKLVRAGFALIFKKTVIDRFDKAKGNVDVLLTVKCFEELENFDGMVLVSGDGDFVDLIQSIKRRGKKTKIIVPNGKFFPKLFAPLSKECLFLSWRNIRKKIEYRKNGWGICGGRTTPH